MYMSLQIHDRGFAFTNIAAFAGLILPQFRSCLDNVINDSLLEGEKQQMILFIQQLDWICGPGLINATTG